MSKYKKRMAKIIGFGPRGGLGKLPQSKSKPKEQAVETASTPAPVAKPWYFGCGFKTTERDGLPVDLSGYPDISIDLERLRLRCYQSMRDITRAVCSLKGGKARFVDCKNGQWYVHFDRGAPILAVCHLDTVNKATHFSRTESLGVNDEAGFNWVFCETLDDRLGVYTVLDVLPALGVKVDILFTTGEETGQSTGEHFATSRKYKWIVEFDRRGTDAVTYGYDKDEGWEDTIVKSGFDIGFGSFSDISRMEGLGVSAFNVGIGYQDEHNFWAKVDLDAYSLQIRRFLHFYHNNRERSFVHKPMPKPARYPATDYNYEKYLPHYYRSEAAKSGLTPRDQAVGMRGNMWCGMCYQLIGPDDYRYTTIDSGIVCRDCASQLGVYPHKAGPAMDGDDEREPDIVDLEERVAARDFDGNVLEMEGAGGIWPDITES